MVNLVIENCYVNRYLRLITKSMFWELNYTVFHIILMSKSLLLKTNCEIHLNMLIRNGLFFPGYLLLVTHLLQFDCVSLIQDFIVDGLAQTRSKGIPTADSGSLFEGICRHQL